MIFTTQCPSCDATFPIDSAKIPEGGVYARCTHCEGVFLVDVPEPIDAEILPAPVETPPEFEVEPPPEVEPAPDVEPAPEAETSAESAARVNVTVQAAEPEVEAAAVPEPETAEAPPVVEPESPPPDPVPSGAPSFGKRDPHERAQRLARVLVSDMIAYHPDRHRQSLDAGTLKTDFEEEIDKSWSEYVDQVGKELAGETSYFTDALNEILAKGAAIF